VVWHRATKLKFKILNSNGSIVTSVLSVVQRTLDDDDDGGDIHCQDGNVPKFTSRSGAAGDDAPLQCRMECEKRALGRCAATSRDYG
jgi:hypothetical protein